MKSDTRIRVEGHRVEFVAGFECPDGAAVRRVLDRLKSLWPVSSVAVDDPPRGMPTAADRARVAKWIAESGLNKPGGSVSPTGTRWREEDAREALQSGGVGQDTRWRFGPLRGGHGPNEWSDGKFGGRVEWREKDPRGLLEFVARFDPTESVGRRSVSLSVRSESESATAGVVQRIAVLCKAGALWRALSTYTSLAGPDGVEVGQLRAAIDESRRALGVQEGTLLAAACKNAREQILEDSDEIRRLVKLLDERAAERKALKERLELSRDTVRSLELKAARLEGRVQELEVAERQRDDARSELESANEDRGKLNDALVRERAASKEAEQQLEALRHTVFQAARDAGLDTGPQWTQIARNLGRKAEESRSFRREVGKWKSAHNNVVQKLKSARRRLRRVEEERDEWRDRFYVTTKGM